jgi:hypothetical protein
VTVSSGAHSLQLAIDTGTSRTLVGARAAERLGLRPVRRLAVASPGGENRAGLCGPAPELRLAGLELALECLGWLPAEPQLAGAEDVDGLLGADALVALNPTRAAGPTGSDARVGLDLWIDLRRGRLRVAPAGSLLAWVNGTAVPLETVGRRPAIRGALPRRARLGPLLVIDSGANATTLFGDLARRVLARSTAHRVGRVETATASLEVPVAALEGLHVGGLVLDAGWTALLPGVTVRHEDGVLPLSALSELGPVLFAVADGVLVTGARLRAEP